MLALQLFILVPEQANVNLFVMQKEIEVMLAQIKNNEAEAGDGALPIPTDKAASAITMPYLQIFYRLIGDIHFCSHLFQEEEKLAHPSYLPPWASSASITSNAAEGFVGCSCPYVLFWEETAGLGRIILGVLC